MDVVLFFFFLKFYLFTFGSVVVAHRPSCFATYGIFPKQELKPRSLHWQQDSQPLNHQGGPLDVVLVLKKFTVVWEKKTPLTALYHLLLYLSYLSSLVPSPQFFNLVKSCMFCGIPSSSVIPFECPGTGQGQRHLGFLPS